MSDRYRSCLLAVLLLVFATNGIERMAFGLLLQDIKRDLALSDTQLGVLTGIAFALFYSIMGIPIARWADRGNRVTIIAITTALWGAAVFLCGLAGSFLQLLSVRIGVAIGEAGSLPPSHSLIADHFSRDERPRAVALFMLGAPLGSVIGFFAAGWLNEYYGWRTTFVLLGLPGFALAVLAWLTLRDPRAAASKSPGRRIEAQEVVSPASAPAFREVIGILWRNRTYRQLLLWFVVATFFGIGIMQWVPAFFIRRFALQTGELGTAFAVIYGVGGLLGTYLGGEVASRYAAGNERWQLKAMAILYVALGVLLVAMFSVSQPYSAFVLLGLAMIIIGLANAPIFATLQTLAPPRMRALSIAIVLLFANLIGMGLGPLAAGVLSDAFEPWAGHESLRYALLMLCPGTLWCAGCLWSASSTVTRDLAAIVEPTSAGNGVEYAARGVNWSERHL